MLKQPTLLNNLYSLLPNGDAAMFLTPGRKPWQYRATTGDLHFVLPCGTWSKAGRFLS